MANSQPNPISPDRWVARCLRRLRFGQFLDAAADLLAGSLFVFGGIVLVVKLALPEYWPHALWAGIGVLPATVFGWWLATRQRFTPLEALAVLDSRLRAGGLLLALNEAPDDEWQRRLPQLEELWQRSLPKLRPLPFARRLTLPILFAIAAGLIPAREVIAEQQSFSTAGQQATAELQELFEELEEAKVLEEEDEQQLNEEIEKLVEETQQTPLTHEKWETVDALRERLKLRVDTAGVSVDAARSALNRLAEATDGDLLDISPEQLEELQKESLETLQKLADKGMFDRMSPELKEQLQRLMKDGEFKLPEDAGERSELLSELSNFLEQESNRLSELRSKCEGQGQCQSCGKCEDGCLCSGPEDSACICPNCSKGKCSSCSKNGNGRPGSGGISRGSGDAPLTWGDESTDENVKFKETILPPGSEDLPRDEVIGLTVSAPDDEAAANAPRSAARGSTAATGDEIWRRRIRPRHRAVVRGYFDSAKSDETK
ncbi:MAG: hypothetical protein ACYTGL_23610 [Planctomycetota bacterium]|jgi:hypothetical protein